jgi:ATP-dependent RNA helicase DeaD
MKNNTTQFTQFSLHPELISALHNLEIITPTEIQEKALPVLLSPEKKDFHGQAQTGTGKTLAFGLPLLHHIEVKNPRTQALIIAPTRELAVQIYQSLLPLAKARQISIAPIYGGISIERQLQDLKKGIQVVIGTPGRLNDHLRRKSLLLSSVKTIVLDEADIMLDMGFKQEVDEILRFAPTDRSIWLFSATVKSGIHELMKTHMKTPISVRISQKNVANANTKQFYCPVSRQDRFKALCRFIASNPSFYGFIFCQTKIETSELAEKLAARGYSVNALHGDMSQINRNRVIKDFKQQKFSILVATDVAARGIDVPDITHVINYQLPEDHESYVHRIGRTGRAGKEGMAITFISQREKSIVKQLEKRFNVTINHIEIPSLDVIYDHQLNQAHHYIESLSNQEEHKNNPYKHKLHAFMAHYSAEQLNKAMLALLEDKFFKAIDTTEIKVESERSNNSSNLPDGMTELMLNIGTLDGIDKSDIARQLMRENILDKKYLGKIRVIKKRSFIKIPSDKASDVIVALKKVNVKGRKVFASIVQ